MTELELPALPSTASSEMKVQRYKYVFDTIVQVLEGTVVGCYFSKFLSSFKDAALVAAYYEADLYRYP